MKVLEGCASITARSAGFRLFRSQLQLDGELSDKLPIEVRIAVFGKLVQNKPITHLGFRQNIFQALCDVLVILVSDLPRIRKLEKHRTSCTYSFENQHEPELVKEYGRDPVEGEDGGGDAHEDKPEPQPKIYLLVDDILNTKYNESFDLS